MEDDFEEFVIEPFVVEEIDLDYEFDAPVFYDFTRPETFWEAMEAEQWFESACSYPPSPFVLKLRWGNAISMEIVNTSADYSNGKNLNLNEDDSDCCMEPEVSAIADDSRGLEFCNYTTQDTLEVKTKSLSKSTRSRISTLMKPTASHLAKQRNPHEVHATQFFRRLQSQNSSPIDGLATKRQKLEAGYLRKAAHLKHQAPFAHKAPRKVDLTDVSLAFEPKATIPREPDLETAHRAQRHKSRINAEAGVHTKSSSHMFKARPLNRKILEAPSLLFCKRRTPQLPKFHIFHLKTSERAMQQSSSSAGGNSNCSFISNSETRDLRRQERCRTVNKLRGNPDEKRLSRKGERAVFRHIKQENVFPMKLESTNDKRFLNEAPVELFSKLSLASEVKQTTKFSPISKGLKENRPESFHQKHEKMNIIKEEMQGVCGKQYQCGNDRGIPDIKSHLYVGRSLHIC